MKIWKFGILCFCAVAATAFAISDRTRVGSDLTITLNGSDQLLGYIDCPSDGGVSTTKSAVDGGTFTLETGSNLMVQPDQAVRFYNGTLNPGYRAAGVYLAQWEKYAAGITQKANSTLSCSAYVSDTSLQATLYVYRRY